MAKNRDRQRHNRNIKEQLIESKNNERYTDPTPFKAVNNDLKHQFCHSNREYEALKQRDC